MARLRARRQERGATVGLAERRKALGYSQEGLAHALGVDRTTIGRWENGRNLPQPSLRRKIAALLQLGLAELDTLTLQLPAEPQEPAGPPLCDCHAPGDMDDDMIRRDFLRVLAVSGALPALSVDEAAALTEGIHRGNSTDFTRMNSHLWQVYQLARVKGSVYPIVREQLQALHRTLDGRSDAEVSGLRSAAADLFQLAGELAFDGNRYTDAAASYVLAASVSKDVGSFDLWACALVRHAYVDMYERQYREAASTLSAAGTIASRGDSSMSTRYWVASVQAEAYAGMGDLTACERALDEAEKVLDLPGPIHNGGWLRFDGSRLAEERGARYVQLGRLNLGETALMGALDHDPLAKGPSFRRRGAVLTDLAVIGAKRRDTDQVVTFGSEALQLALETTSGYVARRLQVLRAELGPIARDRRIAELDAGIRALNMM
ncbi:helix-turn-helix transcriptional regulator [Streptomyces pathocidini]|uniref:helix-turn-helix transcriptional regulator n=1 Tax=Streptomyces pathocidini TaxID=1650571 RepID=UPI0033C06EBF